MTTLYEESPPHICTRLINKYSGLANKYRAEELPGHHYLAIGKKDQLIGCTGWRKVSGITAEQIHTVVTPLHRGQHLGKALSNAGLAEIPTEFRKIFCTVNIKNCRMIAIKLAQGFTIEGYQRNHYKEGNTIVLFALYRGMANDSLTVSCL